MNREIDLIAVHVSATPPSMNIGAKEINAMHKARGWSGIGYHRVVRRNGKREAGRPINRIGAHVRGFNSRSIGVVLVGGVDANGRAQNNMTAAQEAALEAELRDLVARFPNAKIAGHRDLSPDRDGDGIIEPHEYLKECPCFDVIPWAQARGLPVADIKGVWSQPDVTELIGAERQRLLSNAGFSPGAIDGIIGPRTIAALKRFQNAAGLSPTGEFDGPTLERLETIEESVAARLRTEAPLPAEVAAVLDDADKPFHASTSNLATVTTGVTSIGGLLAYVTNPWVQFALIALVGMGVVWLLRERSRKAQKARLAKAAWQ